MPRLSRNTGICSHASFFSGSWRDEIKLNCSHIFDTELFTAFAAVWFPKFDHCHQESQYEMLSTNVVTFCWSGNVNIARFNLIFLLSCCKWCTAWKGFWSEELNSMNIQTKGISFGLATDGSTISHLVKFSSCNSRFRGKILSELAQLTDAVKKIYQKLHLLALLRSCQSLGRGSSQQPKSTH